MTLAENFCDKIEEEYNDPYGMDKYGNRIQDYDTATEAEKQGAEIIYGEDFYSDNKAIFPDGSILIFNYKNEFEVQ